MIVVLAVLAAVGAVVLTRGPTRSATLDLRQAVAATTGTIRLARSRAIAGNQPVTLRLPPPLPAGVAFAAQPATVTLRPDGSATPATITLSRAGRTATVTVDWLTGQAAVTADP